MKPPPDYDLFEVDPDRLVEQWTNHVKVYHYWSAKLADARAEWERTKAHLEVTAAELDRDIRRNPQDFGMQKITETALEKLVVLQKRYRSANEAVIVARHDFDVIQANVNTLDTVRRALESFVSLRLANYYAEPKEPREAQGEIARADRDRVFSRKNR